MFISLTVALLWLLKEEMKNLLQILELTFSKTKHLLDCLKVQIALIRFFGKLNQLGYVLRVPWYDITNGSSSLEFQVVILLRKHNFLNLLNCCKVADIS